MIGVLRRSQSLRCVTHKALERSSNTAHLWSVFETLSQGLTAEWHLPSNHWPSPRQRCAFDHVNRGLTFGPPETHLGQTYRSAPIPSIKTLKYIFITLLTLVVLLYGLPAVLVHLPVVQRRLAAESGRVLSAVLRAPVRIDEVDIAWPDGLTLRRVVRCSAGHLRQPVCITGGEGTGKSNYVSALIAGTLLTD